MTDQPIHQPYLDLAQRLADAARPIARKYFRTKLTIDAKQDDSPVTIADREIEAEMRRIIEETFPAHGILGEEHGSVREDAEWVWVLDPIDGTKSFITGKPLFGTLIGLAHNGVPVLGVIDQPIIGERWIGAQGHPTTFNGKPIETRACTDLGEATMYTTSPHLFPTEGGFLNAYHYLERTVKQPLFGCDCYAYGLLASGFCDIVCETGLNPYDFAALIPVVAGAGGSITDWNGEPLNLKSKGDVLALGDKALLEPAVEALKAGRPITKS